MYLFLVRSHVLIEEVWRRGLKTTTSASASTVSRIARVDEGATESAAETDVPNTGK